MNCDIAAAECPSWHPVSFDFEGSRVRVVVLADIPWWVLADVTPLLGYDRPSNAARCVDDEDKRAHFVSGKRGEREVVLINESGLYSLMLRSRQPDARRFKRWVTSEVLPALRRHGSYSLVKANHPGNYAQALRALADEVEARERAELQTLALEPAATAWNELAQSRGNYSLRQSAFILNQSPDINTGQNRLMKSLVEFGMVSEDGLPYATHAKHVELAAELRAPHDWRAPTRETSDPAHCARDPICSPPIRWDWLTGIGRGLGLTSGCYQGEGIPAGDVMGRGAEIPRGKR